ncbi:MAG: GIY-YIG nuclease family protein [Chloroflexi bacterium]|nr:GIY-YIG nuclease family protein [Chloroflexota bacterium]
MYYVYILANKPRGTIYVGVTNDLIRRLYEHRNDLIAGFTKRYGVHLLVHYEQCVDVSTAIWREKRLKKWNRAWKIKLIESDNPEWRDLYPDLVQSDGFPAGVYPVLRYGAENDWNRGVGDLLLREVPEGVDTRP